MGTLTCIKTCIKYQNCNCLFDLSIENFLNWLIFSLLIGVIYSFFSALIIANNLLKNNRGKLGKGYGTQAADIFITSWKQDQTYNAQHIEYMGDGSHYQPKGLIAEKYLVPRKLVEIFTEPVTGEKKFRVIKGFTLRAARNWLVYKFIVFDLVHKYDDDPEIYK